MKVEISGEESDNLKKVLAGLEIAQVLFWGTVFSPVIVPLWILGQIGEDFDFVEYVEVGDTQ